MTEFLYRITGPGILRATRDAVEAKKDFVLIHEKPDYLEIIQGK
jgi:hypothetical protein